MARTPKRALTSVIFCYSIGKVQRLLAELALVTDSRVFVHGMMLSMIDAYREAGVAMLPTTPLIDKPRGTSFAGELVLAPLSARGTPWMRRLGDLSDGFASGLMRVRGVRRQRAYDRGFVMSDHADWPALLQTIMRPVPRECWPRTATPSRWRVSSASRAGDGVLRTAWEGEPPARMTRRSRRPEAPQ